MPALPASVRTHLSGGHPEVPAHQGTPTSRRAPVLKATPQHLLTSPDPLLTVNLHAIGAQGGDGTVNDLLHHLRVPVGLLQFGGCDPDVAVL